MDSIWKEAAPLAQDIRSGMRLEDVEQIGKPHDLLVGIEEAMKLTFFDVAGYSLALHIARWIVTGFRHDATLL